MKHITSFYLYIGLIPPSSWENQAQIAIHTIRNTWHCPELKSKSLANIKFRSKAPIERIMPTSLQTRLIRGFTLLHVRCFPLLSLVYPFFFLVHLLSLLPLDQLSAFPGHFTHCHVLSHVSKCYNTHHPVTRRCTGRGLAKVFWDVAKHSIPKPLFTFPVPNRGSCSSKCLSWRSWWWWWWCWWSESIAIELVVMGSN